MTRGILSLPIVVEANHVDKSFGRRHVLKDVSLQARRGELVGIVGENGAGKTTLLKILVGILALTRGNISVTGRLGYCPQDCLVFDKLTLEENLDYFSTAYGLLPRHAVGTHNDGRHQLMEWFRFERYAKMLVSDLSAGTKQKLNLTAALLHDPDLLILDEPYSGFDWETYLLFFGITLPICGLEKRPYSLFHI